MTNLSALREKLMHQCLHCGLEIGEIPNIPDCSHTEESKSGAASEARWADSWFKKAEAYKQALDIAIEALESLSHDYHARKQAHVALEQIASKLESL